MVVHAIFAQHGLVHAGAVRSANVQFCHDRHTNYLDLLDVRVFAIASHAFHTVVHQRQRSSLHLTQ